MAATAATCGSYSRAPAASSRVTGRSLALARSYSASKRGSSDSSVATMSFPQILTSMPCPVQKSTIERWPALHRVALRLPGL
jgi:hypothetical protein